MEPPNWPSEPPPPRGPVTPPPPPPSGGWQYPVAPGQRPAPSTLRASAESFVIGSVCATALGIGIGLPVFLLGANDCNASGGDMYCGLGWLAIGFLAAIVVAIAAYVVAGIVYGRKRVPEGRRGVAFVGHMLAPVAFTLVLSVFGAIGELLG